MIFKNMKNNMNKMNKINKIIAALSIVLGTAFLGGCIKEGGFDTPPENIRVNFSSNTTISQLKALHTAGGMESINSNIIIKGKVVANDESGIIYKAIYLEDDSAGIQIAIDQASLFTKYAVGQRVFVKCNGLTLSESKGNLELGYYSANNITFGAIPLALISTHIFPDSLAGTAPKPDSLSLTNYANPKNFNKLVKFDNVYFPDSNHQFCPLGSTYANHQMSTVPTSSLVLYASPYASYALDTVPSGTGSVTGILVKYNNVYELMIRDLNDLKGFNK